MGLGKKNEFYVNSTARERIKSISLISGCQWHYFFSRQTFYGSFTPIAGGKQGYRNQFRKGLIDRLNFTEKKGIFTAFITSIFYYDFSSVYRAYLALFPSFSFKL